MIEQPNTQEQRPRPGQLVLPVYPAEEQGVNIGQTPPTGPSQYAHFATTSTFTNIANPFQKLGRFWHKDAANKVLMIAVVAVVLSGILFMALGSASLLQGLGFLSQNVIVPQNPSAEARVTGTVDLHPTFPTPSGGNGTSKSSQPPPGSSSYLPPTSTDSTPTPQPTATGQLTVQITSIPSQVPNRSTVLVSVTTSEPQIAVKLQVYYNAPPYSYTSITRTTDGSGNVTLPWRVQVIARGIGSIVAIVQAVATDQNGQRVVSPAVKVIVTTSGAGG
jgi:hypothetical protein